MSTNGGDNLPLDLQGLDPAVREAIEQAKEQEKILERKLEQAREHSQRLLQQFTPAAQAVAQAVPESDEKSSQASQSAEGSEEESVEPKGKQKPEANGGKKERPLLPVLPCGKTEVVKVVTKQTIEKITALLQTANITSQAPERLIVMWNELTRLIQGAGLKEAEVLAAIGSITGEASVSLCISPSTRSVEDWRIALCDSYLSQLNVSLLTRRLNESKRLESENRIQYLLRVAPLTRAALLLGNLPSATVLGAVWNFEALGQAYCKANVVPFKDIQAELTSGKIADMDQLLQAAKRDSEYEEIPRTAVPAMPVATEPGKERPKYFCTHCNVAGHTPDECWRLHPELRRKKKPAGSRNDQGLKYAFVVEKRDVFVIAAKANNQNIKLGLDSMAAVNLIRADAVPQDASVQPGGPTLHGIGQAQAKGTVTLRLSFSTAVFENVSFAVIDELPVQALLGKPTLTQMRAQMDLGANKATLRNGHKTISVQAVALPIREMDSQRPQAQSYWNWINKRFAAAPKRLQTLIQDVLERADDKMLEQFLAQFPDWTARSASVSDIAAHPAPYQQHLRRPESVTTGLAVCLTVDARNILLSATKEDDLTAQADDNRDFLPPIMTFEEEDKQVSKEITRLVEEAELSPNGKKKLQQILEKYRAAFGMQLRKVNMDQDRVTVNTNGQLPEHQPRRIIRDPRIRQAQVDWERAMIERGVVGPLTGQPELARPINIHHVIRNRKIRFTADARTRNAVTIADSYPVPSPMEALERFRRNRMFSTFDEADSFFQYPYEEGSRVPFYSAEGGVLEFRVVIQGGKNSPAALHRAKTKQYRDFAHDKLAFMFDDTLLGTPGNEEKEHLVLIEQFLANCVTHGTILKPTKAKLCRAEVVHQGFVLSHGQYRKDPEAVRPLVDMRLPTTASELKSQLSMLGRYRDFIPEFSQLAAPLEGIMQGRWKEDTFLPHHAERLTELRRRLAQETLLTMPDWNRAFHWRIDAQPTFGWAGVVGQEDDHGKFWPIRFMSKKASDADKKRWPTEMEAMAWFYCLAEKGRVYSQYSQNIIHGDPKSLYWLADSIATGRANRQMQRVALSLQALDITFKHHPRQEMEDMDSLSKFAIDHRGSRDELQKFLATDKPVVENTLIAAAVMQVRTHLPKRLIDTSASSIAVPAGLGPNSPPGVPIDIKAEQKLDPVCKFIVMKKRAEFRNAAEQKDFLAQMPQKAAKALQYYMKTTSDALADFEIRNGKLFLIDKDQLNNPRLRLVVPMRLRIRILTANHDAPSAGHRGFQKTYDAMTRLYFWFGMYADAKAWIKSCPSCAKGKRRTIAGHGTAQHMGLVPTKYPPFERVVIDLIGPLPESREGMKYILISVDAHSSETKLAALKSRNSEDIANLLLERIVLKEGCPKSWQSDRAPELISGAVAKLAAIAGIEAKACSAYQAHTEGRVERRNWLVGMMLREMCKDDLPGWPEMLPWVEFAINSSPYSVTGMTPYFHKTGYDPIAPGNAWREAEEDRGEPVETWQMRMQHAFRFAELAHADAASERKKQYDKDKREHGIEDGDNVYMWIPRNNKLEQSAMGPMTVKRFLDPATKRTAVLHPPNLPDQTMVVHVDRLVKAQDRPLHLVQIPSDLSTWIERQNEIVEVGPGEMEGAPQVTRMQRRPEDRENEEWEIEQIVARKDRNDGSRRYRIRYAGYSDPEEDRWYDEEDLREMGHETSKLLDDFDVGEDAKEVQQRIAAREQGGARRSKRKRKIQHK